jgi:hypothetical protein
MADEKGIAYAILGIVAVIAVVGLVLLFKGATGQGVYGGEMRQGESELRPFGESPARYTSPVQESEGGTFYQMRPTWDRGLADRNICPDNRYPHVVDPSRKGARTDCIDSPTRDIYSCCALAGQAGALRGAND